MPPPAVTVKIAAGKRGPYARVAYAGLEWSMFRRGTGFDFARDRNGFAPVKIADQAVEDALVDALNAAWKAAHK